MEIRKIFFEVEKILMLLCYNCDLSLRALAVSFDAWIVHSGDSNHTKWHASSESVDLLEFFKWLSKHNVQVIHYYMNFLIRTPAGSLITAWEKNAPEPGHKPARPPLLLLQTRAYYQVDDAYGFLQIRGFTLKKSARTKRRWWTIGFIICLFVSLHLPIFQGFLKISIKSGLWIFTSYFFFQTCSSICI